MQQNITHTQQKDKQQKTKMKNEKVCNSRGENTSIIVLILIIMDFLTKDRINNHEKYS